jgi:hypothetical protein
VAWTRVAVFWHCGFATRLSVHQSDGRIAAFPFDGRTTARADLVIVKYCIVRSVLNVRIASDTYYFSLACFKDAGHSDGLVFCACLFRADRELSQKGQLRFTSSAITSGIRIKSGCARNTSITHCAITVHR